MSKKSGSRNNSFTSVKKDDTFDIIIMGNYEKQETLFLKSFPVTYESSNIKHKYINRYDFSFRERIKFDKDFKNTYSPELLDKLNNIDILILVYTATDILSFEYLKTFYYLYYLKFEEKDRPKNIILIERDYTYNNNEEITYEEKVNVSSAKELAKLFDAYFCDYSTDENDLNEIFLKCLEKLIKIYNITDDYSSFKYKESNQEVNCFILIHGEKKLQDKFLQLLLKSESNFNYKKIKDSYYEVKYDKIINGNTLKFKIILKLVTIGNNYDSECNFFLYDFIDNDSFNLIKGLIRTIISNNSAKFKKIFNLFSLNFSTTPLTEDEENNLKERGKMLATEIGADFSVLNINNNKNINEEIKNKFDNILDQIINCISMSKIMNIKNDLKKNSSPALGDEEIFFELKENLSKDFINKANQKIKTVLNNKPSGLLNICQTCYSQLNIRINQKSNIIILYCDKCKKEPKGINVSQLSDFDNIKVKKFICSKCKNILNYNKNSKNLSCDCELISSKPSKKINRYYSGTVPSYNSIPLFLKDCYCEKHNKFYESYLKYSKKGYCQTCLMDNSDNNYYIEHFSEENINKLIKEKKEELHKENRIITTLHEKFSECIKSLQMKFEKYINIKMSIYLFKSQLIDSLQIIQNNHTIISNVKSLKFDDGKNFIYNENDSIENRIKYIFNYFNYESDVNNLYFGSEHKANDAIDLDGPYNIGNSENESVVTDIDLLKNKELIIISFNNGKAKIYESNKLKKDNYPICVIDAFTPNQGINSFYIIKREDTIWKTNNTNKNEIIYLNGCEEIKVIQMNYNYTNYDKLYVIKEESKNISCSIELDYNRILFLTSFNDIKLVNINIDKDKKINDEKEELNFSLIGNDKSPLSLRKISNNVIYLDLINKDDNEEKFCRRDSNTFTIYDANEDNQREDKFFKNDTISLDDLDEIPININNRNYENKEKFFKIVYLNLNNNKNKENNKEDNNNNILDVKKEYIFSKKYELLGCISDEDNLFLINYTNEAINNFEYLFYIFDFNICHFTYTFKFHNDWSNPKYFIKYNYDNINDKIGFVIIDYEYNFIQYFYEKDYINKIYYFNTIKIGKKIRNELNALNHFRSLSLKHKILLFYNNHYYILNN